MWLLLALGITLEVVGTLCMKGSDGFRDWRLAALTYVFYGLSLTVLTFAFKRLELSVAYAVWSGAGMVLVAGAGMVCFREPVTVARVGFIMLILVGMLGLHLASPPPPRATSPPPYSGADECVVPEGQSGSAASALLD
jgi:small multidrug resistance pump